MNTLTLFGSTFVLVFSLGLQSLMVNRGHFVGAFMNSLLISVAQLLLLKLGPDATGMEVAGYILGGPFGIVAAMFAFRRWTIGRAKEAKPMPDVEVQRIHPAAKEIVKPPKSQRATRPFVSVTTAPNIEEAARRAIDEYHAAYEHGGEMPYPHWAVDVLPRMAKAGGVCCTSNCKGRNCPLRKEVM